MNTALLQKEDSPPETRNPHIDQKVECRTALMETMFPEVGAVGTTTLAIGLTRKAH